MRKVSSFLSEFMSVSVNNQQNGKHKFKPTVELTWFTNADSLYL